MHCQFALIVTGHGEREFLPSLFRCIMARANCSFIVLRRVGQRREITAPSRLARMVGSGQAIPTRDEEEIGLPARGFLRDKPCHFVLLVDDIERDRRPELAAVFARYRKALDTMLRPDERNRAAVHFFANMLEAYYFADSAATNRALERQVLAHDHIGDVEVIPHPKNELKRLDAGFDERAHGSMIVPELDMDHVLENPDTCRFLRSLFGWCVERLPGECEVHDPEFRNRYRLADGQRAEPMRSQVAHE
jgi:hypothetical protein